jgi:hypothetical protein
LTKVPLDALLRRASRMAEDIFAKDGEISMFWLAENAVGEQVNILTPVIVPDGTSPSEHKDRLVAKVRELFREKEIVRYARASECWTLNTEKSGIEHDQFDAYMRQHGTLANHLDRVEMVMIEAVDGRELIYATREIIRPSGRKPYLGKLSAIERPEHIEGRFLNLLDGDDDHIRSSSELPDDEGKVFIAYVPGAPFVIMGRRDPVTGELCVGRIGGEKDQSGDFVKDSVTDVSPDEIKRTVPPWVEVVTGAEAEELIARVQRKLVARKRMA